MIPVFLTRIKTSDGIILEGIVVHPQYNTKTALIWIHGLSSRFSSGQTLIKELSSTCRKNGIAYFKFNTRGHDIASRSGEKTIGAGFEHFEHCIYDIRAMIRYAKSFGYKKIILAGHSTGANKALYYCYKTHDRAVKGIALLGPISDRAAKKKELGAVQLAKALRIAHTLIKKNPHALMPLSYGIITAKRFISLYKNGSDEDVFPYHTPNASWKELQHIRVPLAIVFGSRDQHRDRVIAKIIQTFRDHALLTKSFTGITIKGADHSFRRKEKEVAREITNWIYKTF